MSRFFTQRLKALAGAASKPQGEENRDHKKGREPDGAPHDFAEEVAQGTPVKEAFFKWLLGHCGTCGAIFLVLLTWILGLWSFAGAPSPFAHAAEVEHIRDVVAEMYARQISSDIRSYQDALCAGPNQFLEGELERAQVEYEKQTGHRYPTLPCPKHEAQP